jgi:hypothetical protein
VTAAGIAACIAVLWQVVDEGEPRNRGKRWRVRRGRIWRLTLPKNELMEIAGSEFDTDTVLRTLADALGKTRSEAARPTWRWPERVATPGH